MSYNKTVFFREAVIPSIIIQLNHCLTINFRSKFIFYLFYFNTIHFFTTNIILYYIFKFLIITIQIIKMNASRFIIPKINFLDETVFNQQRRDIFTNFFYLKETIRHRYVSTMKPLQQQRRSLLHYVKRDRMTTATFLIPTQMTHSNFWNMIYLIVIACGALIGQNFPKAFNEY